MPDVYRRVWKTVFDSYLSSADSTWPTFSTEDYLQLSMAAPAPTVSGPFVASRGIHLSDGLPDDAVTSSTVHGLGNSKNEVLPSILDREGLHTYPDAVDYLHRVGAADLAVALVTSSTNAA